MYQLNVVLPESKHSKSILLNRDQEQSDLYQIILKYFLGAALRKTGKTNASQIGIWEAE